jgi:hypothetical protein
MAWEYILSRHMLWTYTFSHASTQHCTLRVASDRIRVFTTLVTWDEMELHEITRTRSQGQDYKVRSQHKSCLTCDRNTYQIHQHRGDLQARSLQPRCLQPRCLQPRCLQPTTSFCVGDCKESTYNSLIGPTKTPGGLASATTTAPQDNRPSAVEKSIPSLQLTRNMTTTRTWRHSPENQLR